MHAHRTEQCKCVHGRVAPHSASDFKREGSVESGIEFSLNSPPSCHLHHSQVRKLRPNLRDLSSPRLDWKYSAHNSPTKLQTENSIRELLSTLVSQMAYRVYVTHNNTASFFAFSGV